VLLREEEFNFKGTPYKDEEQSAIFKDPVRTAL
jgi:hypothetical protein